MLKDGCVICQSGIKTYLQGISKSWVSDLGGKVYSYSEIRPNSQGHCCITTKRHITDVREISPEEWNDILPILKDVVRKIDKVYSPVGFYIAMPIGKLASQNLPHFYTRIVPKYKKGYGQMRIKEQIKEMSPQEYQETTQLLQAKNDIVGEKGKCIAKLDKHGDHGWESNPVKNRGRIEISPKPTIPNDSIYVIRKLDQQTWNQMGELMKSVIKLMEEKLACENFSISICTGKMTGTGEEDEPTLKLRVRPVFSKNFLEPVGRIVIDGKLAGSMDNERIAEKLRDPKLYYARWKGDRNYLENKNKGKVLTQRERERERFR